MQRLGNWQAIDCKIDSRMKVLALGRPDLGPTSLLLLFKDCVDVWMVAVWTPEFWTSEDTPQMDLTSLQMARYLGSCQLYPVTASN